MNRRTNKAETKYDDLIGIENIFQAWNEFKVGKRKKKDVQSCEQNLEDNLFALYEELRKKTYKHGDYEEFYVHDPKRRHIHKASVQDRVLHHLLYKYLYPLFDMNFIFDSYSCRLDKGTHKGIKRLEQFTRKISKNYTKNSFALKLDIKQFFASIDHEILLKLLDRRVKDRDILWLLSEVIGSFYSEQGEGKGIPLGNLTSQIFANVYMNELDQFIKHKLKIKYYLRYADDFLLLSNSKEELKNLLLPIKEFIEKELKLELHPCKIILRRLGWGIDFLGYIVLPYYILPRTKTKKRIFKKLRLKVGKLQAGAITEASFNQTLASYLGFLKHASSYKLTKKLKNNIKYLL